MCATLQALRKCGIKIHFIACVFIAPKHCFCAPLPPPALEQPLLLLLLLCGNCSKCRLLRIRRMGLMHMQTPQNVAKSSGRTSPCVVCVCVRATDKRIMSLNGFDCRPPCPASASLVSRSRFGSKGAIIVLKHLDKVKRTHIQHTHTHTHT